MPGTHTVARVNIPQAEELVLSSNGALLLFKNRSAILSAVNVPRWTTRISWGGIGIYRLVAQRPGNTIVGFPRCGHNRFRLFLKTVETRSRYAVIYRPTTCSRLYFLVQLCTFLCTYFSKEHLKFHSHWNETGWLIKQTLLHVGWYIFYVCKLRAKVNERTVWITWCFKGNGRANLGGNYC